MNFFRCNCTNIEQGLDIPNSNLFIEQIILHSMNQDKVISLTMDVNVILEGFKLNRKKDCLYLQNLKEFKEDLHYTLTKLNQQFQIPLNNQDDSSQQFYLNLNLYVYEGCYKLLYLQQKDSYYRKDDFLYGEWEIMGSTQDIQIEFIQDKTNQGQNNHLLRDLTNYAQNQHTEHNIEDENPKIMYSISKTPKLKRKR
ncbi:unnamed protein product (macronuclear) [Paramecium tetraurelia]|uniref:Uncharacterized protein n=1 Tax=Paramecium tetraurelia TaxID=5888 RepID=A0BN27_PARTE|nr:uncharacterized protein GSPATT00030582001 [Paramecium tetraurelia]CAK59944.1 unnamed protein product [Paramecium tetraurelia]|eukprot:XP_001427342.1 hypothetical protein (macronuclear) [Paramecium tetraurelia strain d4-2]